MSETLFNRTITTMLNSGLYVSPLTRCIPKNFFSYDGLLTDISILKYLRTLISNKRDTLSYIIFDINFFKDNEMIHILENICKYSQSLGIKVIADLSMYNYKDLESFPKIFQKNSPFDGIIINSELENIERIIKITIFNNKKIFLTSNEPIDIILSLLKGFKKQKIGVYMKSIDDLKLYKIQELFPTTIFLTNN